MSLGCCCAGAAAACCVWCHVYGRFVFGVVDVHAFQHVFPPLLCVCQGPRVLTGLDIHGGARRITVDPTY